MSFAQVDSVTERDMLLTIEETQNDSCAESYTDSQTCLKIPIGEEQHGVNAEKGVHSLTPENTYKLQISESALNLFPSSNFFL